MPQVRTGLALLSLAGTLSCHMPRVAQQPGTRLCRDIGAVPTVQPVPAGWKGPRFRLSHSYPATLSREPKQWTAIDFRTSPRRYMLAARDYVYDGNIAAGFDVLENKVRRWYHMPWRAYGTAGREFVHGLTVEFPSQPKTLAKAQTARAATYALAIYDPVYAYGIGRVWRDLTGAPDLSGAGFPDGAVAAKLLFTDASGDELDRLRGGFTLQANVFSDSSCETAGCARQIRTLTLLQLDIAIKDSRAAPTAWVFMSFVYDRLVKGDTPWHQMTPLGLAWGNDPGLATPPTGQAKPMESTIYPLPQYEHLGCHGRLTGPLDNPSSSCLGCHMTAQSPPGLMVPSTPPCDSPANARFWQNLPGNQPFDTSVTPAPTALDYSQELSSSIENYHACLIAEKSASPPPQPKVRRDQ
jgi:hypothetical protein